MHFSMAMAPAFRLVPVCDRRDEGREMSASGGADAVMLVGKSDGATTHRDLILFAAGQYGAKYGSRRHSYRRDLGPKRPRKSP
jgi:hypothetical protein